MNILFPTDFSENAEKAKAFAIDLVKRSKGKLFVFNAYDLPSPDRIMSTSLIDAMRENATENMNRFIRESDFNDINYQTEVLMGNPIRLTRELVKKHQINMVVMGTKGASGLEEFLIGSNASAVIHSVDIPVYVIPPHAKKPAIEKILLATDMDPRVKERPFKELREFALLTGAKVDILHIQKKEGTAKGARDFLENMLHDVDHSYCIIKSTDKEETILQHSREREADVICSITKRYGFLDKIFRKSLTSQLAYHTSIPLLALHQAE